VDVTVRNHSAKLASLPCMAAQAGAANFVNPRNRSLQ
jgi:hypothetical protein